MQRRAEIAALGSCNEKFNYRLHPRDGDDGRTFFGLRVHLHSTDQQALPVSVVLMPADESEINVLREGVVPKLRRLHSRRRHSSANVSADGGFAGNRVSRALLEMGVDRRIDLVKHKGELLPDVIHETGISISSREWPSRAASGLQRAIDRREGRRLARPKLEPVSQLLPVKRVDEQRLRFGFGGCHPSPELLAEIPDVDRERLAGRWACGARHAHTDPCRAGCDGILFWVAHRGNRA